MNKKGQESLVSRKLVVMIIVLLVLIVAIIAIWKFDLINRVKEAIPGFGQGNNTAETGEIDLSQYKEVGIIYNNGVNEKAVNFTTSSGYIKTKLYVYNNKIMVDEKASDDISIGQTYGNKIVIYESSFRNDVYEAILEGKGASGWSILNNLQNSIIINGKIYKKNE
jgi:hypothetical protein